MIRVAWYTALVLFTLMVLGLLWQFSTGVILFLLSLTIAAAFRPVVETLTRQGLRKEFALAVSYGSVLIVVGALALLATGPLIGNLQLAIDDLFKAYDQLKDNWSRAQNPLIVNLVGQIPPTQRCMMR
jgi:predicted PurR-regulated permease PerM